MKILIQGGRVIDPASRFDAIADVAVAAGRILSIGPAPADFTPNRVIPAAGCVVAPGLVDLAVRLREPGHEHEGMLESELGGGGRKGRLWTSKPEVGGLDFVVLVLQVEGWEVTAAYRPTEEHGASSLEAAVLEFGGSLP